jgi:phenylacetate-CoA ligase
MACLEAFCGMSHREHLASRRVAVWHRRRLPPNVGLAKRLAASLLGQLVYLEPYSTLTNARMTESLRRINRHRPAMILAFASTLFELAKHARRTGIRMHRPRFILTSVEMLFEPMRAAIEEVFGCPVHDLYASAEVGRMAVECSHGGLHVLSFHNHVEILDPKGSPVAPGEVGRVVVTSLHSRAMPLIRYDIGDLARVASEPCACGSPLPVLAEIRGRIVDHFVRSDGGLVFGGNFVAMFYEHDWIAQFHVVQEDVERIRVSFRRTPGRDVPRGALDELTEIVQRAMGEDCAVLWDETDAMPRSPVGKHRHVRSLVWAQRAGSPSEV